MAAKKRSYGQEIGCVRICVERGVYGGNCKG